MTVTNVGKLIEGHPLAEIQRDATAREACEVMCRHDVGAVVVLDGQELVGVLSERDVIRKVVCRGLRTAETPVADIMTDSPRTIGVDGNLAQALEIMSEGGFHHVPVLDNGRTIGLLSADDIPEEYRMMLERFKEMRGA